MSDSYNPDVISCLANLSSDEIFTSPEIANQMLDLLPQELFTNPETKFLDPFTKSGVFLREIAKRLIAGLEDKIPNLEDRIEHIFKNQLYGIAITELTSLLSRRSLYCSKYPNSKYSVAKFDNIEGNIRFKRIDHTWKNNKCIWCGASKDNLGNRENLETHAYEFIHTSHPERIFNMKFDVIIGNPPYQLSDGGGEGSSAQPLYDKFITQSIKLNPKFLIMIVPARWYSGGKGLDEFRDTMLHDDRIKEIHDFPITDDCFPGVNIRGGVCYFLWSRNYHGDALVSNHKGEVVVSKMSRPLLEKNAETFIRYNQAISILKKVQAFNEKTLDERVSSRLPFGIPSNFEEYSEAKNEKANVILFRNRRGMSNTASDRIVWVEPRYILKNMQMKDKPKVLVSKASPGGDEYPHAILSKPFYAPKNSVCTETYLIVDFVKNEEEGNNLISYMATKFFRFLVGLIKNTQNISKGCFAFVPIQDFSKPWTDEELYQKYGLSSDEIAFIESMIKPMDLNIDKEDD